MRFEVLQWVEPRNRHQCRCCHQHEMKQARHAERLGIGGGESSPPFGGEAKLCWLGEEDDSDWDQFVESHPQGTPYHLSGWKGFLGEICPQAKGGIFVLRDVDSGQIHAGIHLYEARSLMLGRRLISSPFATLGGALASSDAGRDQLVRSIPGLLEQIGCRRVELRGITQSGGSWDKTFAKTGKHLHHFIELPDRPDKLLPVISKGIRRCIVKAEKAGVEIRDGGDRDTLAILSKMHQNARQRLGLPVYPQGLFAALSRHLSDSVVSVIAAVQDGETLGVLLSLKIGDRVIAEHIGVSDRGRALGVNHFMFWKDIERAIAEGRRVYSFGRTSVDNAGLIQFKRAWGSVEEPLSTFVYPAESGGGSGMPGLGMLNSATRWTFRSMPAPIARWAGGYFYRHWA